MQDLFYGVHGASNLGITSLSADPIMKKLVFQLSGNDVTLAAQVYGVQVASIMSPVAKAGSNSAAFETVFSLVEDIVGQADEVNEKYLQLEGGLGITSLFIEGAFSLAAKMGKAPTIIPVNFFIALMLFSRKVLFHQNSFFSVAVRTHDNAYYSCESKCYITVFLFPRSVHNSYLCIHSNVA